MRLCSMIFICRVRSGGIEPRYEVRSSDAAEALFNITSFLRLIPEEILPLGEFFTLVLGREDGFEGIGVEACIPRLGGDGHGRGCEVLHLVGHQMILVGDVTKFAHLFNGTARVGGDEIGNQLLVFAALTVLGVEIFEKLEEVVERGFAHEGEHLGIRMFRRHFEPARNMMAHHLPKIFAKT